MRLPPTAPLIIAAAAAGCIQSAYPAYDEGSLRRDPAVVGTWMDPESTTTYVVTPDSTRGYAVVVTSDSGRSIQRYTAHLVRVGSLTVLDVLPGDLPSSLREDYRAQFLPLHSFHLITVRDTGLVMHSFHPDSLEAYLDRRPSAVAHLKLGDRIVLTARPPELRSFLRRYARSGVVCPPSIMVRLRPASPMPDGSEAPQDSGYADCSVGFPT